jgi:hypothetical protein
VRSDLWAARCVPAGMDILALKMVMVRCSSGPDELAIGECPGNIVCWSPSVLLWEPASFPFSRLLLLALLRKANTLCTFSAGRKKLLTEGSAKDTRRVMYHGRRGERCLWGKSDLVYCRPVQNGYTQTAARAIYGMASQVLDASLHHLSTTAEPDIET